MYNKLKMLCKEKGTTVTNLCEIVTGSSGNLATWKKGYMRSDYLKKSAEYLGVTTDYLLGLEDKPNQKENSKPLSKNEKECMEKFKLLTETEQGRILDRMDVFIEEREAKRKGA